MEAKEEKFIKKANKVIVVHHESKRDLRESDYH